MARLSDEDRPAFLAALAQLIEVFQVPVTDRLMDGYFVALEDIPLDELTRGVRVAIRTCKFFPKPAELREIVAELRPPGCTHLPMCENAVDCTTKRLAAYD